MLRSIAGLAVAAAVLAGCQTSMTTTTAVITGNGSVTDLTVVNDTGYPIYFLYISPSTTNYWGNDVLGPDILYSGEAATVMLNVGSTCLYDVRATYSDGVTDDFFGFNVCQNYLLRLY